MYNKVAKIYVGDVKDLQDNDFWSEVQNRLSYTNDKNPVVDNFYLTLIKDEMKCFSNFTTYDDGYIVYMEESTDKEETEPLILFTKDDLHDYNSTNKNNSITHTYIER